MPKITIALMVYNEAKYLEETLESICKQDFNKDIEILVGNNASTDKSSEIIDNYAKKDSRIIHIKRKKNIGAIQNWNDLVDRARGDYFIMAGGHDKWTPNYLKNLSQELDTNHSAVLAFAKTEWIDLNGKKLDIKNTFVDTSGLSPIGKFVSLMFSNQNYLMGMMRTNAIKKTRKQLEIIGSGEIFLQELVQLGDFVLVENERWYRRKNRKNETIYEQLDRYGKMLFSTKFRRYRFYILPNLQMMLHYLTLPFVVKNISWRNRLLLILAYPLLISKFFFPITKNIVWGARNILRIVKYDKT